MAPTSPSPEKDPESAVPSSREKDPEESAVPSSFRQCCLSAQNWKYRRVACFCFAGVVVLAVVLSSVLVSLGRNGGGVTAAPTTSVSSEGNILSSDKAGSSAPTTTSSNGQSELSPSAPQSVPGYFGEPPDDFYPGGDEFASLMLNDVKHVCDEPVSTFSADVDTASYSYCRRVLNSGSLPDTDAVRAEEMINYFDCDYPLPKNMDQPFEPAVMISDSPWNNEGQKLLHIGIKGYDIEPSERRPSNLVFLLDVSGSMGGSDRLPLVKESIELLLTVLDPEKDIISIVTYSNGARVVLEPTPAAQKEDIIEVVRQLEAGGGTSGGAGLALAYDMAEKNYNEDGVNRIILATDGDFNIGVTDNDELQAFIETKRERGIFLSVLGFGMGNYKDSRMKALANHGNGVAAYIDTINEAEKVLVTEAQATIFPIAKDVKFQLVFNPAMVSEYRLVGYEKRILEQEDFDDDTIDAGEIGSGHTVTVIYEIDPVQKNTDELLCNDTEGQEDLFADFDGEFAFMKIRYKLPEEDVSKLITRPITVVDVDSSSVRQDFDFATAVAWFAQILQGGEHISSYSLDDITMLAENSKGEDEYGYRTEFIQLVQTTKLLQQ